MFTNYTNLSDIKIKCLNLYIFLKKMSQLEYMLKHATSKIYHHYHYYHHHLKPSILLTEDENEKSY